MSLHRSFLVSVASLLTLSTLAACAAGADSASETPRDWSFASVEESARALTLTERDLDVFLANQLGLDDETGLSIEEAAEWLPRADDATTPLAGVDSPDSDPTGSIDAASHARLTTATAVSPADYPVPQPDMETVGAAANGLSLVHQLLRDALGEASMNSTDRSAVLSDTAGNPAFGWSVENGLAAGKYTSSISDTNEAGDAVTVALEGEFEVHACPTADGVSEGEFSTTAAVTFTPQGGTPRRTTLNISMMTISHVTDEAYAADLWARVDAAVNTGAPKADSSTEVSNPDSTREEYNAYAFTFGDTGVADRGELTADKQLDGAFSVQVDDLAEQIALLVGRAAEDYWRDGNCVDVLIEGEDINPQPGDKQQLWVDAVSMVDGKKITRGTVEVTEVLGDSTVNPTGRQPIDEADYQFIAGQQIGKADPEFEVVSRRGIGRFDAGITVGTDAWTINQSFAGANYTGKSCDGIHGPWWIEVSMPQIAESWGTELMFDDNLRSYFTAPPTNGGEWVHTDEQFWLEPSADGYVMHNELGGDAQLLMSRADPAVCAE